MITPDQINIVLPMLQDLELFLRNGNVPGATTSISNLSNMLNTITPVNWGDLCQFCINQLEKPQTRCALLAFLPNLIDMVSPTQPEKAQDPPT